MFPSHAALVLAILAVCIGSGVPQYHGIRMTIFYEALDPNSLIFFQRKLLPTFEKINKSKKQYMFVDLVPYGRAQTTRMRPNCEHGPAECTMNTLMACANDILKTNSKAQLQFSTCAMKEGAELIKSPNKCAKPVGLDGNTLTRCSTSKRGQDLEKKMGHLTPKQDIFRNPLPMINVNGKHDPQQDQDIKTDAFKFVCEYLKNAPYACKRSEKSLFARKTTTERTRKNVTGTSETDSQSDFTSTESYVSAGEKNS